MKRFIILFLILASAAGAFYYSRRHKLEADVGPEAMLNVLADTEREFSRVPATVTRISMDEETAIGNQLAGNYSSRIESQDSAMQAYVQTVGSKVAAHARRKLVYRFHYVDDPGLVNAFALPGGHGFIGRGLIEFMKTEDELTGVLGHEIEHIDNYHCVERSQLKAKVGDLADLVSLPVELFQAGYGKEQELEADRDGTYLAVLAGYSPQGAIHMFKTFNRLHREYVLKAESPDQEISRVAISGIVGYFRSHPLPEERIHQIERIAAAKNWPMKAETPLQVHPEEEPAAGNH